MNRKSLARLRTAVIGSAVIAGSMLGAGAAPALAVSQSCGTVPLDIEFILDRSGSMTSNGNDGKTRLEWAQTAADQLVDALQSHGGVGSSGIHHVGVTSFADTSASVDLALGGSNATAVKAAIDSNASGGITPLKAGLAAGGADMDAGARNAVGGDVTRIFILLSDGRPNPDPAQRPSAGEIAAYLAKADTAYSIAIGQGGTGASQVDLALMASLDKPDGHYYNVVNSADLPNLFFDIFNDIACQPGINLDKTADQTTLPVGGGTVNYTYTVTNTGNIALAVKLSDDKCADLSEPTGDTNDNSLLDTSETWVYTCTAEITADTTNTAKAVGSADGYDDVESTDTWTVTVDVPNPTPFQSVAAETDTPTITLPPTDSIGGSNDGRGADAVFMTILALMGLGISSLALTRAAARRRR